MRAWIFAVVMAVFSPLVHAIADQTDLHQYWDDRCQSCHGHAGQFARSTLLVDRGLLVGRHHRENLPTFLQNHYLPDALIAPVTKMLVAQVETVPRFKERCSKCHSEAAQFARESLQLKDGTLTGKASKRPVSDYLRSHGGLAPAEIAPMVETLKRVLGEVGGGAAN